MSGNWSFSEILNHAPLKERTIKEDHVPYMNSDNMYKCNIAKKHTFQNSTLNVFLYRQQQNNVTEMKRKTV